MVYNLYKLYMTITEMFPNSSIMLQCSGNQPTTKFECNVTTLQRCITLTFKMFYNVLLFVPVNFKIHLYDTKALRLFSDSCLNKPSVLFHFLDRTSISIRLLRNMIDQRQVFIRFCLKPFYAHGHCNK